jgi:hypothetical protein
MWRADGSLVVKAEPIRVIAVGVVNLALAAFGVSGLSSGHWLSGGGLLAIGALGVLGMAYVLMAPPRLVVGERSVEIWGAEMPWSEVTDVYIENSVNSGFRYSGSHQVLFRLSRPELLQQSLDRAPRRLGRAAARRSGLVAVPLSLMNAPWEVVVERIELCSGLRVSGWDDAEPMQRLEAMGSD